MTAKRRRLPTRHGGTSKTAPVVDFLPQKQRIEIHIPAEPERGRVNMSAQAYSTFLRCNVGFYERKTKGLVVLCNRDGPEGGKLTLTTEDLSYLVMNALPPT